jgi:hypothetical protein
MTPRSILFILAGLPLVGCEDSTTAGGDDLSEVLATLDAQALLIAELQADLDSVEAELLALQASDTELSYELVALGEEVDALSGGIDLTELESAISENTLAIAALDAEQDAFITEGWVNLQGFAYAADVSSNADSIAAIQADYLTASSLSDLTAAVTTNTSSISAIQADYLTASSLSGYAAESWVSAQGYATDTDLTSLDGRVSDIESDYLTAAALTDLTAGVAANATDIAAIEADYLTSSDLSGYATESWVTAKGYATDTDLTSLDDRVSDIESDYLLADDLTDLTSDLTSLGGRVGDIESDYLVADDLSEHEARIADIEDDYATMTWVENQYYADADELLTLSATVTVNENAIAQLETEMDIAFGSISDNTDAIAVIEADYLTASSLSGYATQSWVTAKGYATDADLTSLDGRVSDIEGDYLVAASLSGYATQSWVSSRGYVEDLADYVSVDTASSAVTFSGANVYVQSGSGYSDDNITGVLGDGSGSLTGLGNLIIGYDEDDGGDTKTGSHNLVIGFSHSYSTFGGLISGYDNTLDGAAGALIGGSSNFVSNDFSVVSGGYNNEADEVYSVVSGGHSNDATGRYSVVSGGYDNEAAGNYSAVSGGYGNTSDGAYSTVSGGYSNEATGDYSAVSGGYGNEASGSKSAVSGGSYNEASGTESVVSGGKGSSASHSYSTVGGGFGESTTKQYDFAY